MSSNLRTESWRPPKNPRPSLPNRNQNRRRRLQRKLLRDRKLQHSPKFRQPSQPKKVRQLQSLSSLRERNPFQTLQLFQQNPPRHPNRSNILQQPLTRKPSKFRQLQSSLPLKERLIGYG